MTPEMLRRVACAGALAWLGLAAQAATVDQATPPALVSATLSNGMQVLIWPDHDIPSVALYNFVRVGSRNELPGKTGLAHFFEHMMFNGTATRAQGEFDRIMESAGGSNNAFTSEDVTAYQDWFPGNALATVLELEADRLAHLALVPKVVETERQVVYSERRLRVDDDTEAQLAEQVQATAYMAHPYGMPVIGWPTDIERWTLPDLQQFYTRYYAPNRCTLVLVGDVDPDLALALIRQHLEPIPRQPEPDALRAVEPEQLGERRVLLAVPAQTPLLQLAYHIPAANHADMPALAALLHILAGGDASRLHQALVESQKLAISVNADMMRSFDPGLLWITLRLPAQGNVAALEQQLDAQLNQIATQGVTDTELTTARNLLLSDYWQQLATIDGKAALLGHHAVFHGDAQSLFTLAQRYAALTPADIQQVAQRYLRKSQRTVGVLQPTDNTSSEDRP